MILTIMQPAYLPWLGYFDRLLKSDCFVLLDHVSMDRNSKTKFTNRNRIRTSQGASWLTVPIQTSGMQGNCPISQLTIQKDSPWKRKHLASIRENYARSSHVLDHIDFLDDAYSREWDSLSSLCDHLTTWMMNTIGLDIEVIRSSDMKLTLIDLILEICQGFDPPSIYLVHWARLPRCERFENSIEVLFHDYEHPEYSQAWPGFESHMSCLDLILNHGDTSLAILESSSDSLKAI